MIELILSITIGVAFFLYSLYCSKKRKVIYTISSPFFNVIDNRYFDLQLIISLLNSVILIMGQIISEFLFDEPHILFITILIFWLVNYFLKWIALRKGLCSNKIDQ